MTDSGSDRNLDPFEVAFLGLTLLLAGIHLYLGLLAPALSGARATGFIAIGIAFFAGFLVRLTTLWRPVLYLLGAAFAIFLGALWTFGGLEPFLVGVITGLAATVFLVLALYLFVREESIDTST